MTRLSPTAQRVIATLALVGSAASARPICLCRIPHLRVDTDRGVRTWWCFRCFGVFEAQR